MKLNHLVQALIIVVFILSLAACNAPDSATNTTDNSHIFSETSENVKNTDQLPLDDIETTYLRTKISYLDDNFQLRYTETYEYDDYGNIIRHSPDRYSTYLYCYNEQNQLIKVEQYNQSEIISRYELEYNENGFVSKCARYFKSLEDYLVEEYEYDNHGNVVKQTYTKTSPDINLLGFGHIFGTTQHSEYSYEYDGDTMLSSTQTVDRRLLERIEYDPIKEEKKITHYSDDGTITYYNEWNIAGAQDICLRQINYNADGTMKIEFDSNCEYNSDGQLIKATTTWDGVAHSHFELEYDEHGNLIKETHYDEMGFPTSAVEYEYEAFYIENN